jgi:hypothetical protein
MAKSLQRLSSDVSSISSAVKDSRATLSEFLKEQAYGVVSQEIPNVDGSGNPLALGEIQLEEDMKGKMLRYSKVVLTFPDGSNPLIIPNDIGNQPVTGQEDQFTVRYGTSGAEIFPDTTYPVGSLILGLDYEANSINAAASDDNTSTVLGGLHVQYNYGGKLSQTNMASGDGGNGGAKPFTYNPTTGEVEATKFKGDGSALTNLPTSDPAGSNTQVQFNDNGSLAGYSTFTFNKYSGEFKAPRILGENVSGGIYQDSAGYSAMYLTPDDFIATNNGYQQGFISNNGGRMGWSSISYDHYATFQVPKGYKVTSIDFKGSANYSFFLYASSWSSANATYKATGTINTLLSLLSYQQLIGNSGDYFMIKFRPSGYGNYIYGCKILLYPT